MIQTTGGCDGESYSITICGDSHCTSLEGLSRDDVKNIADLAMCLLYDPDEEFTWHYEFQPNDVF